MDHSNSNKFFAQNIEWTLLDQPNIIVSDFRSLWKTLQFLRTQCEALELLLKLRFEVDSQSWIVLETS